MARYPDTNVDEGSLRLREYLGLLRTHRWLIVTMTAIVLTATFVFSLSQTSIYESQAKVLVRSVDTSTSTTPPLPPNLETERELVTSEAVARIAARRLGSAPSETEDLLDALSVSVATNTEILEIGFADPEPEAAQRGAASFAESYLDFRRRQVLDDIVAASEAVQQRIAGRSETLADINQRIAKLEQKGQFNPGSQEAEELSELQANAEALETQIAVLQQELVDLSPPETLSVGRVVGPADLPRSPSSPNIIQNVILALIAGLGLGVGAALLRERLDDRLRDREDLELRVGAPVLAVVPRVASWRKGKKPLLVSVAEPKSASAEAYKALRTAVQHVALEQGAKVFIITSASALEGKTATTANLGVALAQAGKQTILVSADLRKPRLHRFFNITSLPGVTGVLAGDNTAWDAMVQDVGVENLQIMPSGSIPTNPAELLGSEQMGRLLASIREQADFVLIDSAPLLPVADSLTLAPFVDGVLFVADAGSTARSTVEDSMKTLHQVNATVVGAVLNNFDPDRSGAYYYYYYSHDGYYTSNSEQPEQPKTKERNGAKGIRRLGRR